MSELEVNLVLQELAVNLLQRQLSDPKWNASFEPYWKSLPEKGTLYSKENWRIDPQHLDLFQDNFLVSPLLMTCQNHACEQQSESAPFPSRSSTHPVYLE